MKNISVFASILFFVLTPMAYGNEPASNNPSDGQSYTKAKRIYIPKAMYPMRARGLSHAGVVEFVYMVDENGNVFEASVVRSSSTIFEKSALESLLKSTHEPAILNGETVESVARLRVVFKMHGEEGVVGERFYKVHKRVSKELRKPNPEREKIQSDIESMEKSHVLTPYALWQLNIIKYAYAQKFSTKAEQVEALQQVLLFEAASSDQGKIEETQLVASLWRTIFILETQQMRLIEALSAYRNYANLVDKVPDEIAQIKNGIDQTLSMDQPIGASFNLNSSGYDFLRRISNEFSIDVTEGRVDKLKLRCQGKFAEIDTVLNGEYKLPQSWGICNIQLIGEAGSKGKVVFY